jgi:hypothetical protein
MSDRFEDDLMEDLMAEPEGRGGASAYDEYEGADEYDEADESDADESDELDELDGMEDEADEETVSLADSDESEEGADELEEAVTDALEADDADEFFGGFRNVLKKVGGFARKVAPIAKMIPIPQAQLIGGAADLIGNVLADEGDEMDALDELADYADEEDGFDALAPVIAGVAIRGALKHRTAKIPRETRRKLVKAVSIATRQIARKHGQRAIAAVPGIVRHARNVILRRGLPAKHLPRLVARATKLAVRSPRALRKLARVGGGLRTSVRTRHGVGGAHRLRRARLGMAGSRAQGLGVGGKTRRVGMSAGGRVSLSGSGGIGRAGGAAGDVCPNCRRRTYRLRGPVTLTIRSM